MIITSVADSRKNVKENMSNGQPSLALDVARYKNVIVFCLKNSMWDVLSYIFGRVSN